MSEGGGRITEAAKNWLKHGPDWGFDLAYRLLACTKAKEKAEALRLYRAGLAYLAGKRPAEEAEICRITGGAYEYTFFNVCFAGDMLSAALDVMSRGKKPRMEVCHPVTGENLWEQFFLQPFERESEYRTLDGGQRGRGEDVKGTETVSYADRAAFHPNFLSVRDPEEREIWTCLYRDFLRLNPETEEVIAKVKETLDTEWRGEDFRIYLACDEKRVEERFQAAFPDRILVNKRVYYDEVYRSGEEAKVIGDVHWNRERDDYRRGLEYLSSLILLSRCRSLIAGNCGGSNAAIYWNGGKYESWYLFDKGFY